MFRPQGQIQQPEAMLPQRQFGQPGLRLLFRDLIQVQVVIIRQLIISQERVQLLLTTVRPAAPLIRHQPERVQVITDQVTLPVQALIPGPAAVAAAVAVPTVRQAVAAAPTAHRAAAPAADPTAHQAVVQALVDPAVLHLQEDKRSRRISL